MTQEEKEVLFEEDDRNYLEAELNDLEALKKALSEEKEKAETHLTNWQRTQADFVNFKKRTEQEKADNAKFAKSSLVVSLLPVLDDLERALDNVTPKMTERTWVEGIELIYRKLLGVLEGQGLSKIEAEGKDFDPNFHQAVLHEEGEEGKVVEEFQKGYMLHDRLLRPAMVKVGKKKGKISGVQDKAEESEKFNELGGK